jgi:hypothetical protein
MINDGLKYLGKYLGQVTGSRVSQPCRTHFLGNAGATPRLSVLAPLMPHVCCGSVR